MRQSQFWCGVWISRDCPALLFLHCALHHHMCTESLRRGWRIRSVSSNNLIVCRVTEQTSEQKILLRKRSAISGREEETMSESDGESQDITSLIFYFFLTCLAVIFIIILFFTCFSGRLCVLMYYMVYKVQVESYLLHIP